MDWRLLEDVPAEEVRQLLSVARRRSFARNEVVFHRHDPADSLHLISKGRFAIRVMSPLGDTVTIGVRGPGDSFGEMAVIVEGADRAATVAALEEAETFSVFHADFERLRAQYPAINQALIAFLAGEVRTMNERLLEAFYVPAERRVLRRLLELATLYAGPAAEVEIPLTQEAIAELAGTARATVNRVLRDEEQKGTVELRRGRVIVPDLEALRARAR
ncbi:MAG TPA: Crp/Fnr family transcriptional regulator [Gaiellaceae bacterium]|jgi:CRP-like cAMP-binding protein|nr:Crp/Fnr family transcriptional regulator [Gaiellaceae bacterium]